MTPTFLTLPPEIRAIIYTHVFDTPIVITTSSHNPNITITPPYPSPLTVTSHLVRAESLPHLNRAPLQLHCLHGHLPPTLLRHLPDHILHRITHITLLGELTLAGLLVHHATARNGAELLR